MGDMFLVFPPRSSTLPQFDGLINTGGDHIWTELVHIDRCNEVRVRLECFRVAFRLEVPHAQRLVIGNREQVLAARVKLEPPNPIIVSD